MALLLRSLTITPTLRALGSPSRLVAPLALRSLSHVHVKCQGKLVVVKSSHVDEGTLQLAVTSPPFKEWLSRMDPLRGQMALKRVEIQAVDMFHSRVGFVKFVAEVHDPDGDTCPGSVFMRGGSVAVLVGVLFFPPFPPLKSWWTDEL